MTLSSSRHHNFDEKSVDMCRCMDVLMIFILFFPFTYPGDLTDAKAPDNMGSQQYEEEWMDYNRILSICENQTVWLDMRGNHGMLKFIHVLYSYVCCCITKLTVSFIYFWV